MHSDCSILQCFTGFAVRHSGINNYRQKPSFSQLTLLTVILCIIIQKCIK